MIELRRNLVHRGPGHFAALIQRALMRVQPGKCRQQAGVNVEQPPRVAGHETGRENAHEASQRHQRGLVRVHRLRQRGVKRLAAGMRRVIDHGSGNALLAREQQALGVRPVADDGGHARAQPLAPFLLPRRLHDGRHVAARARNQNDDVLHGRNYPDCPWRAKKAAESTEPPCRAERQAVSAPDSIA